MHGMGVFTWPTKRIYIGQYKDDKRHGFGIHNSPYKETGANKTHKEHYL